MDVFNALADPTRRKIIELLARSGQLSATEIYAQFQVSPPAISQHLKVLREAKLVLVEKRAQQRIYRINPDAMLELEEWARHITQRWNERFDTLDKLANATQEELEGIYEIGPVVAKSILRFFQNKHTQEIIKKLKAGGVNTRKLATQKSGKNPKISGKSFVVTGTLRKYSRKEAETLIKSLGGRVLSGVSKKTDYLVVGEDPGSKLDKARELNVHILDEMAFQKLIQIP